MTRHRDEPTFRPMWSTVFMSWSTAILLGAHTRIWWWGGGDGGHHLFDLLQKYSAPSLFLALSSFPQLLSRFPLSPSLPSPHLSLCSPLYMYSPSPHPPLSPSPHSLSLPDPLSTFTLSLSPLSLHSLSLYIFLPFLSLSFLLIPLPLCLPSSFLWCLPLNFFL